MNASLWRRHRVPGGIDAAALLVINVIACAADVYFTKQKKAGGRL